VNFAPFPSSPSLLFFLGSQRFGPPLELHQRPASTGLFLVVSLHKTSPSFTLLPARKNASLFLDCHSPFLSFKLLNRRRLSHQRVPLRRLENIFFPESPPAPFHMRAVRHRVLVFRLAAVLLRHYPCCCACRRFLFPFLL